VLTFRVLKEISDFYTTCSEPSQQHEEGGERTTFFVVMKYVVKLDKQGDFKEFGKKWTQWKKKHPDLFKEVKSWKLFAQVFGGLQGGHVEMWEFETMADSEKFMNRLMQNKEFTTQLDPAFSALLVPGTYSMSVWNSVA
jgi:hypothetical protein